ncbi:MAG: rod-binding protein [Eubacteriales bacterium]
MKLDTYYENTMNQNQLEHKLKNTPKDNKELKDACEQFESYFINQMLKEMRKTVPESGLIKESQGEKIFKDMLYEEYAKEAAKGQGLGLASKLYKQLSNE